MTNTGSNNKLVFYPCIAVSDSVGEPTIVGNTTYSDWYENITIVSRDDTRGTPWQTLEAYDLLSPSRSCCISISETIHRSTLVGTQTGTDYTNTYGSLINSLYAGNSNHVRILTSNCAGVLHILTVRSSVVGLMSASGRIAVIPTAVTYKISTSTTSTFFTSPAINIHPDETIAIETSNGTNLQDIDPLYLLFIPYK